MSGTDEKPVGCEHCGRRYKWQANVAGKKVRCKCGQAMFMPAEDPAMDNTIPLATDDDIFVSPARQEKSNQTAGQPSQAAGVLDAPSAVGSKGYCPECKAAVKPDAVIC